MNTDGEAPQLGVQLPERTPSWGAEGDGAGSGRMLLAVREEDLAEHLRRHVRAITVTVRSEVRMLDRVADDLPMYRLAPWKPSRGAPVVSHPASARDDLADLIERTKTSARIAVIRRLRTHLPRRLCKPEEYVIVGGMMNEPIQGLPKNSTRMVLSRPFVDTVQLTECELIKAARLSPETRSKRSTWQKITDALKVLRELGFILEQWREARGWVFRLDVAFVADNPWLRLAMHEHQQGALFLDAKTCLSLDNEVRIAAAQARTGSGSRRELG